MNVNEGSNRLLSGLQSKTKVMTIIPISVINSGNLWQIMGQLIKIGLKL